MFIGCSCRCQALLTRRATGGSSQRGRSATAAVQELTFKQSVAVADLCVVKVAEASLTHVATDGAGKPRPLA